MKITSIGTSNENTVVRDYASQNNHAACRKKFIRADQKSYFTKELRKSIMKRSRLFYKNRTVENSKALKKQNNYCNRLYKRESRDFYSHLDLKQVTDNKMFWKTVNPLFGNRGGCKDNIVLVNGDYFGSCVDALNISENSFLITGTGLTPGSVEESVKMF